jgi:hypothetical protein
MRCSIKKRAASSKQQAGNGYRIFLIMTLLLAARRSPLACPLCKDVLTAGMAKGFTWSILLMLGTLVAVVGTISLVIWRASRTKRGRVQERAFLPQ